MRARARSSVCVRVFCCRCDAFAKYRVAVIVVAVVVVLVVVVVVVVALCVKGTSNSPEIRQLFPSGERIVVGAKRCAVKRRGKRAVKERNERIELQPAEVSRETTRGGTSW